MELGLLNETPPSYCPGQVGTQQHKTPTPQVAGPAFYLVSCTEVEASWRLVPAGCSRAQPGKLAPDTGAA